MMVVFEVIEPQLDGTVALSSSDVVFGSESTPMMRAILYLLPTTLGSLRELEAEGRYEHLQAHNHL